ncbi:MAG: radical SAM protein, partial [Eubacterium sp.]|nr:radical SAM protein [Eubacterium sp.]
VNPQTMNDATLERIGRKHTAEETVRAFRLAREKGFSNINMDLIIGLPGEGEKETAYTLDEIRKLAPDSLTVHALALKRATRLYEEQLFGKAPGGTDGDPENGTAANKEKMFEASDRIMNMTAQCAADLGMNPYYLYRQKNIAGNFENTGYARPGAECLYNILIMEQKQTIIGAGPGASTKIFEQDTNKVTRVENVKNLNEYLSRIDEMTDRKREAVRLTGYGRC